MAKDKQNNLFIILIVSAVILLSIFIIFYGTDNKNEGSVSQSIQNDFPPMQESNNINSIEEDLEATELEDLDKELDLIEAELEASN